MKDNNEQILGFLIESLESLNSKDYIESLLPNGFYTVAKNLWNHHKEKKLHYYLIGLYKNIDKQNKQSVDIEEFRKNFNENESKEVFFTILDNALNSSSDKATFLLGYYAGLILTEDREMDYKKTLIVYALKNINDWDLKFLYQSYVNFEKFGEKQFKHGLNSTALFYNIGMDTIENDKSYDEHISNNEELKLFKSSLEKMASLQMLQVGGLYWYTDANSFLPNYVGEEIYNLIIESKVLE